MAEQKDWNMHEEPACFLSKEKDHPVWISAPSLGQALWAEAASETQPGSWARYLKGRSVNRKDSEEVLADKSKGDTRVTAEVISLLMEIVTEKGKVV